MRALRRSLLAVATTAVFAAAVRLRASGPTPAMRGGWRELSDTDLG